MKHLLSLLILALGSLALAAQTTVYRGSVGPDYPVVIELTHQPDGSYTGRYAYTSTLAKHGDQPSSYLYIRPTDGRPYGDWTVTDHTGKKQEDWGMIRVDPKGLYARLRNAKGKYYDVTAVTGDASPADRPLDGLLHTHLGESPMDFGFLDDAGVSQRLRRMGMGNYANFVTIYQLQGSVEYTQRMYWSMGFMPHACCDPAAVWAYDTRNGALYVWILQDDEEFWWSENGTVPFEFRSLVADLF